MKTLNNYLWGISVEVFGLGFVILPLKHCNQSKQLDMHLATVSYIKPISWKWFENTKEMKLYANFITSYARTTFVKEYAW